jgi:hypothetical protein
MTSNRNISPLEKTGYSPPLKNNSTFQLPRLREFHIGSSPDETVAAMRANNNKMKDKREGTPKPYIETGRGEEVEEEEEEEKLMDVGEEVVEEVEYH